MSPSTFEIFLIFPNSFWDLHTKSIILDINFCFQCWTQSIFWDTVYLCYYKLRLVTPPLPPWWRLRRQKVLILITLDRWIRHFWEKNYIENYFYLVKSTKSTKTTSQKRWRNIIWADFFGHPYCTNGIKTCLGLLVVSLVGQQSYSTYTADIYLFKVHYKNTKTMSLTLFCCL